MKKKSLSFTLALVMVIGLLGIAPFSVNAEYIPITQYGSNSSFIAHIEPITDYTGWTAISDRAGLEAMSGNLNGKYYLTDDIDLSGKDWMPISTFTGTFDGQGHVISNMNSSYDMNSSYGLFGNASNAVIKNIGMEDTQISPDYTSYFSAASAGGICGLASSTVISNCYNTGVISADDLTGSSSYFGGICGLAFDTSINDCYNTASISVSPTDSVTRHLPYYYVGGICGLASPTVISNCYNTGTISVSGTSYGIATSIVGGICGESSSSINYCYNAGPVSVSSASSTLAGGICGNGNGASINDCYNTVSVSAYDNLGACAGGICGNEGYYDVSISNCYSTGSVSAAAKFCFAGGICGGTKSPSPISNSYWNSDSTQTANEVPQSPKKGVGNGTDTSTPLTTEEMKRKANFVGFDFHTVWGIDEGNSYPYLRVFNSSTVQQQAIENLEMVYDLSSLPNAVQVTLSRPLSGDTLFVAYYEGDKLTGFNANPIPQESTPGINIYRTSFTELIPQTATIKAFVWDNFNNMQPLCPAKMMEYENDDWVMVDRF